MKFDVFEVGCCRKSLNSFAEMSATCDLWSSTQDTGMRKPVTRRILILLTSPQKQRAIWTVNIFENLHDDSIFHVFIKGKITAIFVHTKM